VSALEEPKLDPNSPRKRRRWLIGLAAIAIIVIVVLTVSGYILAARFEPYIREQSIAYLEKRFNSVVEIQALRISLPKLSPLKVGINRGRGLIAHVEGEGISVRHKNLPNLPPMFVMKHVGFDVDLRALFNSQKYVPSITIDGMEINIPPKGTRPDIDTGAGNGETNVYIEQVDITNSKLRIIPNDDDKAPLEFDLHRIHLGSAGKNVAMRYDATLTNAKPPGEIQSKGTFGPWAANEPGDTPLTGKYEFQNADLGVFDGIAGILHSTGNFDGTLDSISVQGEATVPDFRLKDAGNRVPLFTRFNVLVDGTNGDTILKPVVGRLGKTEFTTSGGIIKRDKDRPKNISLNVSMPNGYLRDLLTLAMKGDPFMEGRIQMNSRIDIPPLKGKVSEKLRLDGTFEIKDARFLRSKIQNQIDTLSRRGKGKPGDETIVEVPSGMAGTFNLANSVLRLDSLSFAVPGAGVDLQGHYNLKSEEVDFHGALRLQAKVSQTFSGWKRWALKPVDPFFSKQGAGTLLHIQVTGTADEPHFGLDHGH